MRLHPLTAGLALLVLWSAAGCSSGPACAIDTDCPLGNRCGDDGACHELGEVRDSGPSMTDAGARDGGAADARVDARTDAGDDASSDSGPADAGDDAGPSCPATPGAYPLTTVGVGCGGRLTATTLTLTELTPPMTCAFGAQLDAVDSGGFAAEASLATNQLLGMLSIGGAAPVRCVATFTVAGPVDIVCDDGCTFGVMRAP